MSAIVAVLNKQAVALAADSAVTIGVGGKTKTKIFNRANKLFTLSKFHPVGIMVYNSATFMSTPWETIIKIYRHKLGEKYFGTLNEYQEDFISFLKSKNFYTDEETQKTSLYNFFDTVITKVINEVVNANQKLIAEENEENKEELLKKFIDKVKNETEAISSNNIYCNDFLDYPFEDFKLFSKEPFDFFIDNAFVQIGYGLTDERKKDVLMLSYQFLRSKENYSSFSGLVFVGFGEDEIYPQLIPINIFLSIQNRLKYYIDADYSVSITNNMSGAVAPFAQQDVMDTILKGVDDNLNGSYFKNFVESLTNQKEEIASFVESKDPDLAKEIRELDSNKYMAEFARSNNDAIRNEYINPMITAVSQLSKEDLAEMAESLIYLTYLKRRITFAEESVGGAVDVAIISKGDGFVWIKRKLYFDAKLNEHFIDNYLNK